MSRNKIISVVGLLVSFFCFASVSAAPVDVNSADAQTLAAALHGIGSAKAQAIVEYRTANGDFDSISELSFVKGIGERTVVRNRDDIALNAKELADMLKRQASTNLQAENTSK